MSMSKSGITAAVLAVLSLVVASAFTTRSGLTGTIYFGMDAPLTGATQLVGQSDRDAVAVDRLVLERTAAGSRARRSLSMSSTTRRTRRRPYRTSSGSSATPSTSGSSARGTPPRPSPPGRSRARRGSPSSRSRRRRTSSSRRSPYVYVLTATSRLYAYNEAAYLRKLGIKKVWLMGDNGGFGRDGPTQVQKLANKYGLEILDTTIFSPASTDFSAELTKVKDSGAQALWLWTATPAGATIVKQFKQLQLPQQLVLTGANVSDSFLQGTCGDIDGAIINSFVGTVWAFLPKKSPCGRPCGRRRRCSRRCSDAPSPTSTPTRRCALGVQGGDREGRVHALGDQHRARDQDQRSRHAGRPHPALEDEPRGRPASLDVGREDPELQGQAALRNGVRLNHLAWAGARRRLLTASAAPALSSSTARPAAPTR